MATRRAGLLLIFVLCARGSTAALFGRATRRQQQQREATAAELSCGAVSGAATYLAGGQLYKTWRAPGMSIRLLRRPLLTQNQQIALGLAGAAAGTAMARALLEANGPASAAIAGIGRAACRCGDAVGGTFSVFGERAARRREAREREARREWLRANTKPAKIYRQYDY